MATVLLQQCYGGTEAGDFVRRLFVVDPGVGMSVRQFDRDTLAEGRQAAVVAEDAHDDAVEIEKQVS